MLTWTQSEVEAKPKRLTQRAAAKILGVHHCHLNKVVRGHRPSASLTARYQQLLSQHAKPTT